jgi:hypothetical protein
MKKLKFPSLLVLIITTLICAAASAQNKEGYVYKPQSQELYKTIVHMDSVYFNAYNPVTWRSKPPFMQTA